VGSSSPKFWVKIKKIFELPPPIDIASPTFTYNIPTIQNFRGFSMLVSGRVAINDSHEPSSHTVSFTIYRGAVAWNRGT